jgi:glucokinase
LIGAVDIGRTKIAVGMIDKDGKVLARRECPTDADRGYAEALRRIIEMLRAMAQTTNTEISGIGIGSAGPVYPLTGEIGDVNVFLSGASRCYDPEPGRPGVLGFL